MYDSWHGNVSGESTQLSHFVGDFICYYSFNVLQKQVGSIFFAVEVVDGAP